MTTRKFLVGVTVGTAVLMAMTVIAAPTANTDIGIVHLGWYNLSRLPMYLLLTLARFVTGTIIGFVLSFIMMRVLGIESWQELMYEFEKSRNDSHATLIAGFFLVGMITAAATPLTNLGAYLVNVVFRGGTAVIVSTWLTVVLSWAFGIRSLAHFESWVEAEDNDSHAILVAAIFLCTMIVCVLGR